MRRRERVIEFWTGGTSVNFANDAGMTSLHAAVHIGDPELVAELLGRGANADAVDRLGRTPLHLAVSVTDTMIAAQLLDAGADIDADTERRARRPSRSLQLHWNEPAVRLLLERGAWVQQPVPESLLAAPGPPAEPRDRMRTTLAEQWQRQHGVLGTVIRMYRAREESPQAREESERRDPERLWSTVRTLIEFGADPSGEDWDGVPLLLSLIEFDAPIDLLRLALGQGASPNPTTVTRPAPIAVAVDRGRIEVVEALLESGANPGTAASVRRARCKSQE